MRQNLLSVFCVLVSLLFISQLVFVVSVLDERQAPPRPQVLATTTTQTERFIPIGSGTIQNTDWEDVPGLEVYIDTRYYKKYKATFEVSIENPTGNGSTNVRLYNVTDKHPVWYSEVASSAREAEMLTSGSIVLDTGGKLYRVQMKNDLNTVVHLRNARIRIISS